MDVTGTPDNDQLQGTTGNDRLYGLDGNDALYGGAGDDYLSGGEDGSLNDADVLYGDTGNDTLVGGAGGDYLEGQAGNDQLSGGAGNDRLYPGSGSNLVDGGDGRDEVLVLGSDTVSAGAGNDTISLITGAGMTAVRADGEDGDDWFQINWSVEETSAAILLSGGPGSDTFAVSLFSHPFGTFPPVAEFTITDFTPAADRLDLLALLPFEFGENPFGASGYFRLLQRGADTVVQYDRDGANGSAFGWLDAVVLQGIDSAALDQMSFSGYLDPAGSSEGGNVTGTADTDLLLGGPLKDRFEGAAGADQLSGAGADDYLSGGDEDEWTGDAIAGGAGQDTLLGGAGIDTLYGGAGNDSIEGGAHDDSIEGNAGDDLLSGGDGDDELYDTEGSNTYLGGAGNDWLYGAAGAKASHFDGGDGNDSISPGVGAHTVFGGAGNDYIDIGGWSAEGVNASTAGARVDGGAGDDRIALMDVGPIKTVVTGGGGRDTYTPTDKLSSRIEITDFAPGLNGDVIDFSYWNSDFYTFQVNPFGQAGYARAVQSGADTILEFDRDGSAGTAHTFEQVFLLRGILPTELTVENFTGAAARTAPPGMTISGDSDADVLAGGGSADILNGMGGDDRLDGGADNDKLAGGDGNDTLLGGRGNDTLDGGPGRDRAIFDGNLADFNVSLAGVTDLRGHGTDKLSGIERLVFNDTHYALDIEGVAGQAYRLYQAAFNRKPDLAGLGYWIGAADRGLPLEEMSAMFFQSPEFDALYGASQTNEELVRLFYVNALHREPDEPGIAYWTDLLDRGVATAATILTGFSESAENKAATATVIGDGFRFDPTYY